VYVLLVGAKRNVGDHLIVDRAMKLLRALRPERELVTLPRWEPLDAHLDIVNAAAAVILCGGPALQKHLYPGVYPLVEDLSRIRPPLVAFGLGWKWIPGDERDLARFEFDRRADPLLSRLSEDQRVSVRDYLADRVLRRRGVGGVRMTGDPAWYDLDHIGGELVPPTVMSRIVVSVPADPVHHPAVETLARRLTERFREARVVAAFHHGWTAGPHVAERSAQAYIRLKERLEAAGYEAADLASDLASMETLYGGAALHVGWRLHAHLFCLSRRQASFLLEEDCRGRGASEALGVRGVRSWCMRTRFGRRRRLRHRSEAVPEILAFIEAELGSEFVRVQHAPRVIDQTFRAEMKPFIERMP
jgi:hypothetical protein